MASLRSQRKIVQRLFAFLLAQAFGTMMPAAAATTELVVSDWRSGIAIDSMDPVAYFTDARPLSGHAGYEYRFSGVIWRFRNEGNRAAFAATPSVYMPQFGGYDPVAIARGVPSPGDPSIWLIVEQRLYLFNDAEGRDAFSVDPHAYHANATEKWPDVRKRLVP